MPLAPLYAASILPEAAVRLAGVGAAYVAAYILPVTLDDVENTFVASAVKLNPDIKLAAAGLNPRFPVILVVPVVPVLEIPEFARIT
jgi:hypothetical protein